MKIIKSKISFWNIGLGWGFKSNCFINQWYFEDQYQILVQRERSIYTRFYWTRKQDMINLSTLIREAKNFFSKLPALKTQIKEEVDIQVATAIGKPRIIGKRSFRRQQSRARRQSDFKLLLKIICCPSVPPSQTKPGMTPWASKTLLQSTTRSLPGPQRNHILDLLEFQKIKINTYELFSKKMTKYPLIKVTHQKIRGLFYPNYCCQYLQGGGDNLRETAHTSY